MTSNKISIAIQLAAHDPKFWRVATIAEFLGVKASTLASHLHRAGYRSLGDRIDEKRIGHVARLWNSGQSRESIAYAVGLSSGNALDEWARRFTGKSVAQLFGRKKRAPRRKRERRA